MKNIYKSTRTGYIYADSEDSEYVWKWSYNSLTWYKLERRSVNSIIFHARNIFQCKIKPPPDWEISMKQKLIRAF